MKLSKKELALIKADEEIIKNLYKNLCIRHKKGGMSGGNFLDTLKDVFHGLALPFTSGIGRTVLNIALPGVGEGLYQAAKATDHAITGQGKPRGRPKKQLDGGNFLDTMKDAFTSDIGRTLLNITMPLAGEAIYQTTKAIKKGRGRPKKIKAVIEVKKRIGRPCKVCPAPCDCC